MKSILLFTNNLRLKDNLTLEKAFLNSESILPIFIFDENLLNETIYGNNRFSEARKKVLLEALIGLEKNLAKISLPFYKFFGNKVSILKEISLSNEIDSIYLQKEFAFEEIKFEEELIFELPNQKINLVNDGSLIHIDDLEFEVKNFPDIFSNFRNKVEKNLIVKEPIPIPKKTPKAISLNHTENTFFKESSFVPDKNTAFPFVANEEVVEIHLENYIWFEKRIKTYKETRNGLIGKNYSTKFSTFLSLGLISARKIFHEIKKFESLVFKNESTYWVIFELLWRDFFRFQFRKYNEKFFLKEGIFTNKNQLKLNLKNSFFSKKENNLNNKEKFFNWKNGNTQDDFVNANMNELNRTGFMSNRGRQNVASYLVNDLGLDFRLGAEYFESLLIDYDVYSNYGNWAYVAGVGNDPRKDRYFDTEKQARMYDREMSFRNLWLKNGTPN